eukprot:3374941-Amphidinium_carterae.1
MISRRKSTLTTCVGSLEAYVFRLTHIGCGSCVNQVWNIFVNVKVDPDTPRVDEVGSSPLRPNEAVSFGHASTAYRQYIGRAVKNDWRDARSESLHVLS